MAHPGYVWVYGDIGEKANNVITLRDSVNWVVMHAATGEVVDEIVVVITSGGGSVYDSLAMYDYLVLLKPKYKITTVASGFCMSAAVVLLQAGDTRWAGTGTMFMTHAPLFVFREGTRFNGTDAKEARKSLANTNKRLINIIARRMGKNYKHIAWMFTDKEYYFDSPEAMQRGFVDKFFLDGRYKNGQ